MIIDYNDLIKSGHISPENKPTPTGADQIYACYIEKDGISLPKFNITTKEDVVKSIEALNVNVDLPDDISKVAKYFVKQAAVAYDIKVDWDTDTPSDIDNRTITLPSDYVNETIYGFTLKSASIKMDSPAQIKHAEDYFRANVDFCSGGDRHYISQQIVKAAATRDYKPSPEVVAYSNLSYSSDERINELLDKRAAYAKDPEIKKAYENLKDVRPSIQPLDFLNLVSTLDKTAGINNAYMPAYRFFTIHERLSPEDFAPEKSMADKYQR